MAVRYCGTVFCFRHNEVTQTCRFIDIHTVGKTFLHTFELSHTIELSHDDRVEWIPVSDNLTSLNSVARLRIEVCTIWNWNG